MIRLGDTFTLAVGVDRHLQVVISDPQRSPYTVVLANFTSWAPDLEQVCEVQPGEHPWVVNRTLAYYGRTRMAPESSFAAMFAARPPLVTASVPLSPDLLRRVLDGARRSVDLDLRARQVLTQQGLI